MQLKQIDLSLVKDQAYVESNPILDLAKANHNVVETDSINGENLTTPSYKCS